MQSFDYVAPTDFDESFRLLAQAEGHARALQGGTDLLVQIRSGLVSPEVVVDLKRLPGMQEIRLLPNGWLLIGAACSMNQVANANLIRERYDLLAQACNSVASYQLRNRATIGGNCCNGSPAADSAPALLCFGAVAQINGPGGGRQVPIEDFFRGPGSTALERGEILTGFLLPPAARRSRGSFSKLGRTRTGDIATVSVAVWATKEDDSAGGPASSQFSWRIALGAVGPTPLRTREAEESLAMDNSPGGIEAAAGLAAQAARPIDDLRASGVYRRAMVRVLTRRGIEVVLSKLEGSP